MVWRQGWRPWREWGVLASGEVLLLELIELLELMLLLELLEQTRLLELTLLLLTCKLNTFESLGMRTAPGQRQDNAWSAVKAG